MARLHGPAPRSRGARASYRQSAVAPAHGRWLAVAVIAGLFAMHGLGIHGLHSGEVSSATHSKSSSSSPGMFAPATSATGMSATGHDDDAGVPAEPLPGALDATSLGSATDKSPKPSGGAGLLGLCLTLLAIGVLWLRRWIRGRPAWTIHRRVLAARVAQLLVTARDLSPRLRAELSIWRC